jgi:homogentisate phytyltransferase/homogentisate geranylgeranyltransferase
MSLILSILPLSVNSKPLSILLILSALIGSAYSVPPFRFKVNPFMALLSIVSVRGFLVPTLVYLHALQHPVKKLDLWKLGLSSPYFMILSLMISIMKDVPDAFGDRLHGIETFTLRFGGQRIMDISNILQKILNIFAGSLFILKIMNQWNVLSPSQIFARGIVSITFLVSSFFTFYSIKNPEKSYMRLWDFFYYSYAVLPFLA